MRLVIALSISVGPAIATAQPLDADGTHLYVALPQDVSREEALQPGPALRDRLRELVKNRLASQGRGAAQREGNDDRIVAFLDHEGSPILPDLEAARLQAAAGVAPVAAVNELSFTFDSPAYPWSPDELDTLRTALDDFYPVARRIYGAPAFDITVNVRRDPTITYAGLYFPSLNEMVLPNASSLDALCHEMIHAFRDDVFISLNTFEEGMARTAEVEVFNQLGPYQHWDENHRYGYDVYYEGLDTPVIGARGALFYRGYVGVLLRYQLSGYAWAKALIENPDVLADFNAAFFSQTLVDPTAPSTEGTLVALAARSQPTVEGKPFVEWYRQQGVFSTDPPIGYFLYHRINQFTVDFFYRDAAGGEINQPGQAIRWAVYDYNDAPLASGSEVTTSLGWMSFNPAIPPGYSGRIRVVASAMTPDGEITSTAVRSWGGTSGVFGVVQPENSGTVTITSLDGSAPEMRVDVVNGAFSAPPLAEARGTFQATFQGTSRSFSKRFTKDASDYFLFMEPDPEPPVRSVDLDIKPGSAVNPINPASRGLTPVAILSSPEFDAVTLVVGTSLTFGRTGDEQSLHSCSPGGDDVNADGLPDLVCRFKTELAGFQTGDSRGVLKGRTSDGSRMSGVDVIRVVPDSDHR